ncbi:MAG TPA: hypothetical protein VFQ85_04105, partial [Mycobacteriales bacterium]|nr:hypothetical protein [Mycobacteriales bacterium]
ALVAVPPVTAAPAPAAITFGVPRVVDPTHVYGEPDIKVAPNGDVHVSGPNGTGTQRSVWNVSHDGGDSYRVVQGVPVNDMPAGGIPNKSSLGPGGGDTEIYIARNGKVFYDDLWALVCFTAATTDDRGATVQSNPKGCSFPSADRQWMAGFDPAPSDATVSPYTGPTPLVYLSYTSDVKGQAVDMSTDGVSWDAEAGQYGDGGGQSGNDATIVVDQHTGDLLSATSNAGNGLSLAVGEPDAAGKLTFHYNEAVDSRPGSPGVLFPVVTQDTARNVYLVWTEEGSYQVFYTWAAAADGWKTWAPVRQVSTPPATTNVFSWAQAGGPGILDVAWYGTETPGDPSEHKSQVWWTYFAQVSDATGAAPHVEQVRASPHPMHYDDICLSGAGCILSQGNRNLADFFEVTIDNDGRARIVYPDTSNGLIQPGFGDATGAVGFDAPGAEVDTVLTQSTGLNAWTGAPLTPGETTAPLAGVTDPPGDALFQPIGGSPVPAADIRGVTLTRDGDVLHIAIDTTEGTLADAATATGQPFAELVLRWQRGDTLWHAAVESDAAGANVRYYAGATRSLDLCSVSACNPQYLEYVAPPAGATAVTGSEASGKYTIDVPLSAIGDPKETDLFEEVMAFVTVSAHSAAAPQTNAETFADAVPLQVEGTRTWNYRLGATGTGVVVGTNPGGSGSGGSGSGSGGSGSGGSGSGTGRIPATGLPFALPLAAAAATAAALAVRRRRA